MKYKLLGLLFTCSILFGITSCEDGLEVVNPNQPTLEVLTTEDGLLRFAASTYLSGFETSFGAESSNFLWQVQVIHESMGDVIGTPWGNFGYRWANQPTSVTLDDGTVVPPPQGDSQPEMLASLNDRSTGDLNIFRYEWTAMYRLNNVQNQLLQLISESTVSDGLKSALRGWAYFWKGFAYSRIGSMYSAGVILDAPNQEVPLTSDVNANFVSNAEMITAANANWDLALTELNSANEADFATVISAVIPDFFQINGVPTIATFMQTVNTLRARTLLANTKVADMTAGDWATVQSLAADGLQQGTPFLEIRGAAANDPITNGGFYPHGFAAGLWHFVSERLIQDFNDGDTRMEQGFNPGLDFPNPRGRGIHYGSRWEVVTVSDGGLYFEQANVGEAPVIYFGSWEENTLMQAEAAIYTGDVEGGLMLIDEVRDAQNAGVAAVAGAGLSMSQAIDELRKERRTGLFLRGVSFYDARRWGRTDPVSQGGGRSGAWVLDGAGVLNTNATIDYNYLNYFGVPAQEVDFNPPADGSASVDPM